MHNPFFEPLKCQFSTVLLLDGFTFNKQIHMANAHFHPLRIINVDDANDVLFSNEKNEKKSTIPQKPLCINFQELVESSASYTAARQEVVNQIEAHRQDSILDSEAYDRHEAMTRYTRTFIDQRLATTGPPTTQRIPRGIKKHVPRHDDDEMALTNILRRKMHGAFRTGQLDLKSLRLQTVPQQVYTSLAVQLMHLVKEYNFSDNRMEHFSPLFCDKMVGIQTLIIKENRLADLPANIAR